MAELQKQSPMGNSEMAQRFVQFVIMQTQNIYYVLGRIPSPDGRELPPNLEAGKLLIDQLEMIKEKVRGNLIPQENQILEDALTNVRLAFVEASGGTPVSLMPPTRAPKYNLDEEVPPVAKKPEAKKEIPAPMETVESAPQSENKKKFTKSYG